MIRAVLGGSFDPVHNGHLALARRVLADDLARHLHVVPAARNPHKSTCPTGDAHRLAMLRLAFADWSDDVTVEDLELRRPGPSYTVDTLEALAERHPDDDLRLLCGADNLPLFSTWKASGRLLELADLVVFARPEDAGPLDLPEGLKADRVHLVDDFHQDVSSTRIRAMLATGKTVANLAPPAVTAYIGTHQLYLA